MPSKMFVFLLVEVVRICRATSTYIDFLHTSNALLTRIKKQGANNIDGRFFGKCFLDMSDIEKFNLDVRIIRRDLITGGT